MPISLTFNEKCYSLRQAAPSKLLKFAIIYYQTLKAEYRLPCDKMRIITLQVEEKHIKLVVNVKASQNSEEKTLARL